MAAGKREDHNVFPSSQEEAARLRHLNSLVQRALGGLPDLSRRKHILDLACGPGGWTLDVGAAYPEQQIIGVDNDPLMIRIAQEQALVAGKDNSSLPNVSFQHMLLTPPFPFESDTFDYIHTCGLASFLSRVSWPDFLVESFRLLRPGGTISCTEAELPVTSSAAFERYCTLIAQAYRLSDRNLSGGVRAIGVSAALPYLLRLAGFQHVKVRPAFLDFSADGHEHRSVLQNAVVALRLLQPFLIGASVTTLSEIEALYLQALEDMHAEHFVGSLVLFLVQGEKAVV